MSYHKFTPEKRNVSKPMSEQMQKLAARYEKATGKKFNAKTNAQKIRAMSDEELATFISEIADECERNTECNQHCYGCDIEYCVRESCLKWLQQPAEENKHETD